MSFDKSGEYPKVNEVFFSDQKYQSTLQKYALIVHAYLCLVASYIAYPFVKTFDYLRDKYALSNDTTIAKDIMDGAPMDEEKAAAAFRPFGSIAVANIYAKLVAAWNFVMTPFRALDNFLSNTDSLQIKDSESSR